jgi:1-acyl-sn-glycerol-3-phosphate acyltransferase
MTTKRPAKKGPPPKAHATRRPPKVTQRSGARPPRKSDGDARASAPAAATTAGSGRAGARPEPRGERPTASRKPDSRLVVAQIRELEAQLDRLIDDASRRDLASLDPDDDDGAGDDLEATHDEAPADDELHDPQPELLARVDVSEGFSHPDGVDERHEIANVDAPPPPRASTPSFTRASTSDRLSGSSLGAGEGTVFDTARELLSSDFYLRKWGRLAMRGRSEEVDDFGFDPIYDQKARAVLEFLYTRYFRIETTGIERVPARGRCLLVANHSGTVPLDGVMIKTAVKLEHAAPRDVRWLTEDFIYHMPFLGSIMNRLGAVRACQENAERLLEKEQLCAVFPEGVKGIGKLFGERYRLQRFGRGGFIKLCLRTNTPIIPVAVVGAEETNPLLFKVEYLSKALGLPYVPVTPTFPALGPLGLLPAPTKWKIQFGEPIDFGSHGREAAEDELLVGRLAERVRATIQGMLDRTVGARKSVFFG